MPTLGRSLIALPFEPEWSPWRKFPFLLTGDSVPIAGSFHFDIVQEHATEVCMTCTRFVATSVDRHH